MRRVRRARLCVWLCVCRVLVCVVYGVCRRGVASWRRSSVRGSALAWCGQAVYTRWRLHLELASNALRRAAARVEPGSGCSDGRTSEHREAQPSGDRTERTGTSAAAPRRRATREFVAEKARDAANRIFLGSHAFYLPLILYLTQIRETTRGPKSKAFTHYPPKKASPH